MSSRDIDSTSENVLHDWASDESREEEQDAVEIEETEADEDASPAWGTTAAAIDTETDDRTRKRRRLSRLSRRRSPRSARPEIDETPMHIELSHEHAMGDLHIPDGYAVLEGVAEGGRRAVGVVVSRFNGSVTTQLLDSALAELSRSGVRQEAITIMVVPGAFELPLAATALAKTRRFACIVALGCVIRGDTPHFDYVSSEAASGLQLAALETGVPVSFGVLTLDRVEQAEARIGKGAEAVRSALEMADLFAHLRAAAAR